MSEHQSRLVGKLLVASSNMELNYFSHSVIYIVHEDDEDIAGFVINKPTSVPVFELLDDLQLQRKHKPLELVLEGGPVKPERGILIHTGQPVWQFSQAIQENICLTSSRDILFGIANTPNILSHYLVILGHTGWHKQQLKDELKRGDWHITSSSMDIIFNIPFIDRWQYAIDSLALFNHNDHGLNPRVGHA